MLEEEKGVTNVNSGKVNNTKPDVLLADPANEEGVLALWRIALV